MSSAAMRFGTAALMRAAATFAQGQRPASSSLLLQIGASGSMGVVGGGNPEVKIEAARRVAAGALSRATSGGLGSAAVPGFSGDCQNQCSASASGATAGKSALAWPKVGAGGPREAATAAGARFAGGRALLRE